MGSLKLLKFKSEKFKCDNKRSSNDQSTHAFLSAILVSLSGSLKINASWSQVESAVLHKRSEAAAPADLEASSALIRSHRSTRDRIRLEAQLLWTTLIGEQNYTVTG